MNNKLDINTFNEHYWSNYLKWESNFIETFYYVDLNISNFNTYSLKFRDLLLSVCSEIDVFGKFLACNINPSFIDKKADINSWWQEINKHYKVDRKFLYDQHAIFEVRKEIDLIPWKNFRTKNKGEKITDQWWTAYNKVKHERVVTNSKSQIDSKYYYLANLGNVCRAYAGLYILEHSYIVRTYNKDELDGLEKSKLFECDKNQKFKVIDETLIIE